MSTQTAKNRVLIISYFAGLDSSAASHHIDDRLPELKDQGVEFEIISSISGKKHQQFKHYQVISGLFSGWRYEIRHALRRRINNYTLRKIVETVILLPILIFYAFEKLFIRLDATWSWFITASLVGLYRVWRFKPNCIYVTGGAVSGHMAGLIVSRITGIPFVSEFQDPIIYQLNPKKKMEKKYNLWLEDKVAKYASKVIFLTANAAAAAKARHPQNSDNIIHIYPGLFPLKKLPRKTSENLIISHFGTLAGSRNLDTLLAAIEKNDITSGLEVHLYGHLDQATKNSIVNSPTPDLFKIMGKVSRDEALARMADADILLLVQNSDDISIQTIPSKVYEYMQTGKPILSFTYKNKELDDLLIGHGHFSIDMQAIHKTTEALFHIVNTPIDSLYMNVEPYTYGITECVQQLIEVVTEVKKTNV